MDKDGIADCPPAPHKAENGSADDHGDEAFGHTAVCLKICCQVWLSVVLQILMDWLRWQSLLLKTDGPAEKSQDGSTNICRAIIMIINIIDNNLE